MPIKGRKPSYQKAARSKRILTPRAVDLLFLEKLCLDLRERGYKYDEIAEELANQGYRDTKGQVHSTQSCYNAVQRAVKRIQAELKETVKHQMVLDARRLDTVLRPAIKAAEAGDLFATDRVVKILERRSKMFGYDAPTKTALTNPEGDGPMEVSVIDRIIQDGALPEDAEDAEVPVTSLGELDAK